jgi:hypothetical protein
MRTLAALLLSSVLLVPALAAAQDSSHWGVAASVTPAWKVSDRFKMVFDADSVDLRSSDVSIGIARGRQRGGDWSVSFVRKNFKDGSSVSDIQTECEGFANGCFLQGESLTTHGVRLNGIEAVKFIPFATIRSRVQVGLALGGGVGTLKGTLDRRAVFADGQFDNQGRQFGIQRETHETVDAKELFALSVVPLGKVEIAGDVIVAPGMKVRAAGGFDFPGSSNFALSVVYLFGAR